MPQLSLVEFSKNLLIERLKHPEDTSSVLPDSPLTGHDMGLHIASLPIPLPTDEQTLAHWTQDVEKYRTFAEEEYGNVGEGEPLIEETIRFAMKQLFSFSETALSLWNEPSDWTKHADAVQEDLKTFHQFHPEEIL